MASRSGGGPAAANAPAACRTVSAAPPPPRPTTERGGDCPTPAAAAAAVGSCCCCCCCGRDDCCEPLFAAIARFGRDEPCGGAAEESRPGNGKEGATELAGVVRLEMGARRRERFSAQSSMKSLRALGPRPWKKWGCVRLATAAAARAFAFDGAVGEPAPGFGCGSAGAEPPPLLPPPDPAPSPKRAKCSNLGAASLQKLEANQTNMQEKCHQSKAQDRWRAFRFQSVSAGVPERKVSGERRDGKNTNTCCRCRERGRRGLFDMWGGGSV